MWSDARKVIAGSIRDFLHSWRSLAVTDLAYKVVAFALLTPATTLLLRWLMSRAHSGVVTDADILLFFVNTHSGVVALFLIGAILLAIVALEAACLMAIGLAAAHGKHLGPVKALAFGAARAASVLRLTAHIVVRLLAGLLPIAAAAGLVYWALLREHDINYYLSRRPPEFWAAGALAGLLAVVLAALLLRAAARWALALPLVLFENVSPRRALGDSARRSGGHRSLIVAVLASWGIAALALALATTPLLEVAARSVAPHFAGSLAQLLLFIAGVALLWGALGLAVSIVNFSLFALVIAQLYVLLCGPQDPARTAPGQEAPMPRRLSVRAALGLAAIAALAAVGFALLAFLFTRGNQPVLVFAHRGSSLEAPENTLSAFRKAVEEKADFVELDVQESADGEVMVVHDSDLMKMGGSPLKIWEATAAQLRAVDLGSRMGPQFAGEKVPTLTEVLAECKGKTKVDVELKSYGHDQHLEGKVVALVEAAGMQNDCIFMSLDRNMVRRMKGLRPSWRCGVLIAKALGDPTSLGADFLAVEARMATGNFVRRAHRARQDVYVWTVDDPAWMLAAMSRGADGLITNRPDLARRVVASRAQMSDAERLLVALLIRLGARTEALESEGALRP